MLTSSTSANSWNIARIWSSVMCFGTWPTNSFTLSSLCFSSAIKATKLYLSRFFRRNASQWSLSKICVCFLFFCLESSQGNWGFSRRRSWIFSELIMIDGFINALWFLYDIRECHYDCLTSELQFNGKADIVKSPIGWFSKYIWRVQMWTSVIDVNTPLFGYQKFSLFILVDLIEIDLAPILVGSKFKKDKKVVRSFSEIFWQLKSLNVSFSRLCFVYTSTFSARHHKLRVW